MTGHPPGSAELHRHSKAEDAGAILVGTLLTSLGLAIYAEQSFLTGGLAGLALLLTYTSGLPFWLLFSLVNLPFYVLSVVRMGLAFTLRTFVAVSLVSLLASRTGQWIGLESPDPVYAAVIGSVLCGVGLLVLFRHRTALGGLNILALFLQERFGLRAGYVQLAFDLCILAAAFFVIPLESVVLSIGGSVILNGIIAFNHVPGRYTATT